MTTLDPMRAAFLAAIRETPDDDFPRLVYADWLEENGAAADRGRAEFIRCQCWLARHGYAECGAVSDRWCPVCGDCTCPDPEQGLNGICCPLHGEHSWHDFAHKREDVLESLYWLDWIRPHAPMLRLDQSYREVFNFSRGFVGAVVCPWEMWELHGAGLIARHPLDRVTLAGKKPSCIGSGKDAYWQWTRDVDQQADDLRGDLFDCLRVKPVKGGGAFVFCVYGSEQAALDDLSAACILWARGGLEATA